MYITNNLRTSLALLLVLLSNSTPTHANETLQISSGIREPLSNLQASGFNDLITKEIFKRAGYTSHITRLPAARALNDLNNGVSDADLVRIKGITNIFPNILVVPEKIINFDFVAISKNHQFKAKGWNSLNPYEIGIVDGWKILEVNTKNTLARTKVNDTKQLINILKNDRIDIAISERWQALLAIKESGEDSLIVHEPPIKTNEMFLVVNIKHKDMIPKLSYIIKTMKKDGSFNKIYNATLGKLTH